MENGKINIYYITTEYRTYGELYYIRNYRHDFCILIAVSNVAGLMDVELIGHGPLEQCHGNHNSL